MKLPDTSLEAYHSINNDQLREMYVQIKGALKSLDKANYEEIAIFLNLPDPNMVSRRLKEMEGLEMIYKPGTKSLTTRKRNAYQYSIRTEETVVPVLENHYREGVTTASDYASELIAKTKQGKLKQTELFEK